MSKRINLIFYSHSLLEMCYLCILSSGVARAFPGGRLAHREGQIEVKKEEFVRKIKKEMMEIWGNMRKVELFPTRYCEAGYAPDFISVNYLSKISLHHFIWMITPFMKINVPIQETKIICGVRYVRKFRLLIDASRDVHGR